MPAYNEERFLPALLQSVTDAREAYGGGAEAVEVIAANNGSTDATASVAAAAGCRVVEAPIRCIAAVRNAGARTATGEILAFVDADTRIHRQTFNEIAGRMSRPDVVGGATGVTLDRWSVALALTCAAMLPLVWATGFDTGVVFCRREDFDAIGGYDERLRFAEDVAFLLALRRLGRSRSQRLVRVPAARATASTRKFDDHGDWHYFGLFARAPFYLLNRRAADRFADRYWYRPRR